MIHKEVYRHGGLLPKSFLEVEAKRLAFDAFSTYDPDRNTRLSTHVASNLRGLGRLNYTYQNALRMPEERQRKYSMFMDVKEKLRERFGRAPSVQELAEELAWPEDEAGRMERDVHIETSEPSGGEVSMPDSFMAASKPVIDFLYHDMSPEEKIIFESITGYKGSPQIGVSGLARKLGLSEPQVRRKRDKLVEKIRTQLK
jgi:DNA-directed RNA polymerase sigma subunit (sigma70/sigma32)